MKKNGGIYVNIGDKALKNVSKLTKLPVGYAAGMPKIDITGFDLIRIEEHRGLMEYGSDLITVRGLGASIRIRGANLQLEMMNETELIVRGDLFAVEFTY
jgi:sporulation protein YqfC